MSSFFEALRLAVNRVADGYEAKRKEYLQSPEAFERETRGDIKFTIKGEDLSSTAVKALPMALGTMLPLLMKQEFEYTIDRDYPENDIRIRIDSGKVARPDINDFPEFPKAEILGKLRAAEAELKTGWSRQPGSGDAIATRIATSQPPFPADRHGTHSLVKEFIQEGEERPLAVTLLHALAKSAFSFDEETHMDMYKEGAQGHVFPGDVGIVKDGNRWVVAFSANDSLGRNPKATNVLDLLGVNSVSPSR